ncbi:MAG TPA: T9SS type A sorting domain-containing protein [Candidatus Eisenbacteria bacterium]
MPPACTVSGRAARIALIALASLLPPVMAHAVSCDGLYFCETQYAAGAGPHALVVGDFNADHILDVAIANAGDAVTLHFGLGSGGVGNGAFASAVSIPVPGRPFGLAAGDFNADGILDLVTANYNAGTVSILLGQGVPGPADGTFAPPANYAAGPAPYAVTTGDFNGDGITDLAVSNNTCSPGTVSVLLGRGEYGLANGSFGPPVAYAVGCLPANMRAADLDRDGTPDLVVSVHTPGSFEVLLGRGDGAFDAAADYVTQDNPYPYDLKVADLNSDGNLDLGIVGYYGLTVARGRGDGTFGAQTMPQLANDHSLEFGDFNRDGVTDVVDVGGGTNVLHLLRGLTTGGVADGRFQLVLTRSVGNGPLAVEAADFNADSKPDLAVANYNGNSLSILLNVGSIPSSPDAGWVADGARVCAAPGDQTDPRAVSDGAGGAIVAWEDRREAASAVFAERMSEAGTALWPANGIPLCADTTRHASARIAQDGEGGAWVAWLQPGAQSPSAVVLSRVTAGGAVGPCPGRLVSSPGFVATDLALAADGAGGVFVAYSGGAPGGSVALYCQRLSAAGLPAPGWPSAGVRVAEWTGEPSGLENVRFDAPVLGPDPSGGTAVAWQTRYESPCGSASCPGVYSGAARITAEATLSFGDAFRFPEDDACGAPSGSESQLIATRSSASDLLVRRIGPAGEVEWTFPLCTASGERDLATLTPEPAGGAAAIWTDRRFGNWDLFASRITEGGALASGWPSNGLAVTLAAGDQVEPRVLSDADQGLTLCWVDRRAGGDQIYAIQLDSGGGPKAGWQDGGRPICSAEGDRSAPALVASGSGAIVVWQDGRQDRGDIYAQRISGDPPVGVDSDAPPLLGLGGAHPNPARGMVWARFTLAGGAPAALELFDLAGRRVLSREVGGLGPGAHRVGLSPASPLAPGLYTLRLRAGDRSISKPVIVTR